MKLELKEVNSKETWERFVLTTSPASYFQSWLWGEVQKRVGRKVWRWGFYDKNDLIGVAQTTKIVAKRGTFLHVRHGPILKNFSMKYLAFIANYLKDVAKRESAWFVRASPLIAPSGELVESLRILGLTPAPIHAMDGELCWVLDITVSEEELLLGMRKSTRYDIRHGGKTEGLQILKASDMSLFADFVALYEKTAERRRFIEHRDVMEEAQECAKEGKLLSLVGTLDGQPVSAALIVFYGHQAIYRHGASVPTTVPVSALLQWEALKEAKKRQVLIYNFWGIAHENEADHPWKGITVFKTGFGGREVQYVHAYDLPISRAYYFTKAVELIRKVSKGYT